MINWEHDICDHGVKVGRYVAGISESQDQLSSLLSWNQAYIDRFISRIPDPLFPCAVLQQIGIFEKFENRGFGTLGIEHFLDAAIKKGCKMALTQVGFYGDPISEIKKKRVFPRLDGLELCNLLGDSEKQIFGACEDFGGSISRDFEALVRGCWSADGQQAWRGE